MATIMIKPLPEFTRVAWASAEARAVWEPRVRDASLALLSVEVESVRQGLRRCALQFTKDTTDLRRFGELPFAPVAPGRCVVARSDGDKAEFLRAWHGRDDITVGALLGFPECCTKFFHEVWNVQGLRDTTLAMAGTPGSARGNILGRWLGVRYVPHLPCSWACEETAQMAKTWEPLWPQQALDTMQALLNWPALYSALHGIAIVTFPALKVVTNTDYTRDEQTIRREGTMYPTEAPNGVAFPFQKPRAIAHALRIVKQDHTLWKDNGFATLAAQDAAHGMVMQALGAAPPRGLVVDFGCGNGTLLRKIAQQFGCATRGVEVDPDRAARGNAAGTEVIVSDIAECLLSCDTAVVSERRLGEMPWLLEALRRSSRQVLKYSYDAPQQIHVLNGAL